MSTVTELKELYVKLGGKLSDVKGIQTDEEMIEKIAKTKLGIELPVVGTSDNGNLLAVSGGTWKKAILSVSIDENYVLSMGLEDEEGTLITAETIDLPLESMFIDIELSGDNLIITLQNGNSITVSLSSLFSDIKIDELTYYEATGTFTEGEGVPTSFDDYKFGGNYDTRIDPEDALEIGDGLRLYPAEGKTINDYSEKVFVIGYDENGNYVNNNGSGELYVSSGKNYLEITKGHFTSAVTRVLFSIYNDPTLTDFVLVRMNAVMSEEKIKVDELIEKTNPNIYKYSVTGTNNNEIYIPEEAPNGTKGVLILDSSHDVQVTLYGESYHLINCILAKAGDYISIEDIYEYGELQEVFYVAFRPSKKTDSQTPLSITYAFVTDIKNESTAVQELVNSSSGEQSSHFVVNYTKSGNTISADMTYEQINEKIAQGLLPIAILLNEDRKHIYNIQTLPSSGNNKLRYASIDVDAVSFHMTVVYVHMIEHDSEGNIYYGTRAIYDN